MSLEGDEGFGGVPVALDPRQGAGAAVRDQVPGDAAAREPGQVGGVVPEGDVAALQAGGHAGLAQEGAERRETLGSQRQGVQGGW